MLQISSTNLCIDSPGSDIFFLFLVAQYSVKASVEHLLLALNPTRSPSLSDTTVSWPHKKKKTSVGKSSVMLLQVIAQQISWPQCLLTADSAADSLLYIQSMPTSKLCLTSSVSHLLSSIMCWLLLLLSWYRAEPGGHLKSYSTLIPEILIRHVVGKAVNPLGYMLLRSSFVTWILFHH